MGLDYVELIMATEETFGIEISDEEAQNATTPGKLLDVVMKSIKTAEDAPCLTQQAFYLFRRACVQVLGIKRNQFRPDTDLNEMIPKVERPQRWEDLKCAVGASNWPQLLRARSLTFVIAALSCAVFIGTGAFVKVLDLITVVECTAAAWLTAWLCLAGTRRFKWNYSAGIVTVGDVAKFLAERQAGLFRQSSEKWNRDTVWPILRNLITEQTGVSEFNEDSHFIHDIGID